MSADLIFSAEASSAPLVFGESAVVPDPRGLVFSELPGTTALVFGGESAVEEPVGGNSTVTSTGKFPPIVGLGGLSLGVVVSSTAVFPALKGLGASLYLINVQRPTVATVNDAAQNAWPTDTPVVITGQIAQATIVGVSSPFQQGASSQHLFTLPFTEASRTNKPHSGVFTEARGVRQGVQGYMDEADPSQRVSTAGVFQDGVKPLKWATTCAFEDGLRDRGPWLRNRLHEAVRSSGAYLRSYDRYAQPLSHPFTGRFQKAWVPRPGQWVRPVIPVIPPNYWGTHLVFACPPLEFPALVFGAAQCGAESPGQSTIAVPVRKVYIVINNITLHRLDTGAELHAHSFSMSLDYQSWTWSWSASLHEDAAPHLGRDSQGDPAEIVAQVNGIPFRLWLVSVGRDRRFSPTRWNVSGQGKAAILATPWSPVQSFGNPTSARTAQQLMADALTINGVGIGWTVDWGLQDWLVPAGVWAIRGSYIDAINDIAAAVGGYVQPHATDAVLRILPRYPAAPWTWASITPDFEIPEDAAEVEATQYIDRPGYNRVFVGGVGAGVFGPFTRAGTAGNVIAPQVTHALITDATAHRQRGIAELSDTGKQEHITLTMQVLPETGVIVPGQLVRYLGDIPTLGIVRSTSIDWSRPKLRQTIKLETHV